MSDGRATRDGDASMTRTYVLVVLLEILVLLGLWLAGRYFGI
ncbi:MAG TPA: hypothetical protein VNE16_15510 [Vicinamibacterales bacterium]|nr:hypothetical protein [Vicinamibacterales bacterium]